MTVGGTEARRRPSVGRFGGVGRPAPNGATQPSGGIGMGDGGISVGAGGVWTGGVQTLGSGIVLLGNEYGLDGGYRLQSSYLS